MDLLSLTLLVATLSSMGYGLCTAYCTWSFFRPQSGGEGRSLDGRNRPPGKATGPQWPPVSIIKPLARLEESDCENFAGFCRQDYPRFELIFAFPPGNEPRIEVLERLKRAFPGVDMDWALAAPPMGPNHKVGNLIAALKKARYPVLAISDADMRVGPGYLKAIVSDFQQEGTGLVTCLYRNVRIDTIFAALQALTIQTLFIPNVLFSRKTEGLSYGFGATLCTSREVLSRTGGVEPLLDYLADDYQMGNRIRRKGYEVRLCRTLIDQVSRVGGAGEFISQQLRAGVTQKVCRPLGHFASVITHQTALSLLFLLAERFSPAGWTVFAAACAARIVTGALLNRTTILNREVNRYLWLIPLSDLVNTLFWLVSLFTKKVQWKGRTFRLLKGGKMEEVG